MKRFLLSCVMVLAAMTMYADRSLLSQAADEIDEMCPMMVDDYTLLTRVVFNNDEFIYYYVVDDSLIESVLSSPELKKNFRNQLETSLQQQLGNADFVLFIEELISEDISLKYVYKQEKGEKQYYIKFNPDQLRRLMQ